MDFIPTRGSAVKRKAADEYISMDYKSHKTKKSETPSKIKTEIPTETTEAPINVFNIKKAKHEVYRFGMTGFSNKERQEARVELAIKLGAKPERKKYINYKDLKQVKTTEKELLKSSTELLQLGKNTMGKSTAKGKSFDKKRKMNKNGIINDYGVIKPTDKFDITKSKRNPKQKRKLKL